jgi:hypothetical protein
MHPERQPAGGTQTHGLIPCMPCHPHPFMQPSAAMLGTTSAVLRGAAGQGAVVQLKATSGIVADNLLTVLFPYQPLGTS